MRKLWKVPPGLALPILILETEARQFSLKAARSSRGGVLSAISGLVVFTLDHQHYGIRLTAVERVAQVVEIAPLPKAPEVVIGVINAQEQIIPVISLRKRFDLPEREIDLSDQLIIARTKRRKLALLVNNVTQVISPVNLEFLNAEDLFPNIPYLAGVLKLAGGLLLIHDLDQFLSLDDEAALDEAMK